MSALAARVACPAGSRRTALVAAAALVALAVVHLLDGPGSLEDVPYIGALELALAAACVPLAVLLVLAPIRELWVAVAALVAAALALYVASRTIGLPGSTDDVGNWGQALGLVNVAIEIAILGACAAALRRRG